MASLSERDLLHARGLLHLHKGEKQLPSGMHLQNEPRSTGVDIAMTVLSLATVAASRATRNTGWIEQYRSEMQKALSAFDAALAIDAEYAPAHHGRAQALRYLGDQEQALGAARTAAAL
jgi:Tfp pilus assembly protein PilF